MIALIIPLAFMPCVIWLIIFYRTKMFRPGPKSLLLRTFIIGMFSVLPVLLFGKLILGDISMLEPASSMGVSAFRKYILVFFGVGLVEETAKFVSVKLSTSRSHYIQEPLDGIIYAAAAGLGFAAVENVLYIGQYGMQVVLLRGFLSNLAHAIFPIYWGFLIGYAALKNWKIPFFLFIGLLISATAHALFDHFLFEGMIMEFGLLCLLIVVSAIVIIKTAKKMSPYRDNIAQLIGECHICKNRNPASYPHCTNCGTHLNDHNRQIFCGKCGEETNEKAKFCNSCGSYLLKTNEI